MPPAQEPHRRGRPHEDPYLCSGRDSPVRCSSCAGHLTATVHQRGATYEDGGVRHHYRSHGPAGCGRNIADVRALDRAISAMTLQRLTDPRQLAMVRKIQEEHRASREPYLEEIRRREEVRSYWDKRLTGQLITIGQHAEGVAELDAAIASARKALAELDSVPVPDLDDVVARQIATGWNTATPAQRYADLRRVWRGFEIFVTPGSTTETAEQVRRRISRPRPIPAIPGR